MLKDQNYNLVLFGSLVVAAGVFIYFRRGIIKEPDPLKQWLLSLQCRAIGFSVVLVALMFLLPSTPSFSTFNNPNSVKDVTDPQKLLEYLQEYNLAITRMVKVLYFFLFLFILWFLSLF